jgi:hypothetical protein
VSFAAFRIAFARSIRNPTQANIPLPKYNVELDTRSRSVGITKSSLLSDDLSPRHSMPIEIELKYPALAS